MNTLHLSLISVPVLAVLMLTGLTLTANAQAELDLSGATDASYSLETRADEDCDDTDERCEPGNPENISVTRELDKATPAATPDTNVCDGVTCPDGSCAATADECVATSVDPDFRDEDSDGDGIGDATERAVREGGRTIDAGTVPEQSRTRTDTDSDGAPDFRDEDSDGDGLDDGTERAQSHNSSRSNRTEGVANGDLDGDGYGDVSRRVFDGRDIDVLPEATMRASGFIKFDDINGESPERTADGEVVCWGRAEDEDGRVYAWGRGLCVAVAASQNASEQAKERLAALQVRGDEVRAWSEEEQSAWREYRATQATSSPEERLLERMIEKTQTNERIREITSDDEGVAMRYRAEMRLFGVLPIHRDIATRASIDGDMEVDYPWYRFLSRVPDRSIIEDTLRELQAAQADGRIDKTTPVIIQ